MARRSFAHTERPQGSQGPLTHRPSALDALSALARRGSADINAELLQKPMPKKPLGQLPDIKPPSPVAVEAMQRSMQPIGQPVTQAVAQPVMQPMQQAPVQEMPVEQPMQVDEAMIVNPPYESYWRDQLAASIERMPGQGPDWRHEALQKFTQIRSKLDAVKAYLAQDQPVYEPGIENIKNLVRDHRRNSANV